jgi:hypothetical protein
VDLATSAQGRRTENLNGRRTTSLTGSAGTALSNRGAMVRAR